MLRDSDTAGGTPRACTDLLRLAGSHIRHGMRAADGAIEHLRLENGEVEYQTIGGAPPVGICGSGVLDALAQLHQAGIVDRRGKMADHPRVRVNRGEREFVLVDASDGGGRPAVTVTERDIQEVQLAKGAIRTGIQILLQAGGRVEEEIERVIIAGAFGSYIDVASAVQVGMLPPLPLERFRQVGNAAGTGARLALVSQSRRAEAQRVAQQVGYIELAAAPRFMQVFARSMYLGSETGWEQ